MFSHMFGFFWKHQIVCSWFMAALSDSQCVALKWDWSAASAFLPCLNSPALYTLELKPLHIVFCAYRAPWMIHRVMIWWLCLLLWLRLMRQRGFPLFSVALFESQQNIKVVFSFVFIFLRKAGFQQSYGFMDGFEAGIYHLVMTNIANWKITMLLRTVNHLFRLGPWLNHGELSAITRG